MLRMAKKLALLAVCSVMLAACASADTTSEDTGVQELQPGDQTVIQAPQPEKGINRLEERAI